MAFLKWVIVLLAFSQFGYMVFDGVQALVTGDYIRPQSGEYAGQLGPWSGTVSAVGIAPEGTFMKVIFIAWGIAGLWLTYRFARNTQKGSTALLVLDVCTLWYAWMGTVSSLIQVALLVLLRSKRR